MGGIQYNIVFLGLGKALQLVPGIHWQAGWQVSICSKRSWASVEVNTGAHEPVMGETRTDHIQALGSASCSSPWPRNPRLPGYSMFSGVGK